MIKQIVELRKTEKEQLDELLYREDILYSNRVNFFLVSQSMLFLSYVTALTISNNSYLGASISCFISIFGIIISWYFYFIFRSTVRYLMYLRENLKKIDFRYRKIWENRKFIKVNPDKTIKTYNIPGVNYSLGPGLSICFSIVWFFLLFFLIPVNLLTIVIFSIILYCIVAIKIYLDYIFPRDYASEGINKKGDDKNKLHDEYLQRLKKITVIFIIFYIIFLILKFLVIS